MINEDDEWSTEGPNFLAPERLEDMRRVLDQAPLILEHRRYRGSSAPDRIIFDGYDDLIAYLHAKARPGDKFLAWNYSEFCRDDNWVACGKAPDAGARTPRRSAY